MLSAGGDPRPLDVKLLTSCAITQPCWKGHLERAPAMRWHRVGGAVLASGGSLSTGRELCCAYAVPGCGGSVGLTKVIGDQPGSEVSVRPGNPTAGTSPRPSVSWEGVWCQHQPKVKGGRVGLALNPGCPPPCDKWVGRPLPGADMGTAMGLAGSSHVPVQAAMG